MDGFSGLAVYAAALSAPAAATIGFPSWLASLGVGEVLWLLAIAVALTPVALVVRGERPPAPPAAAARQVGERRRSAALAGPLSERWLRASHRG